MDPCSRLAAWLLELAWGTRVHRVGQWQYQLQRQPLQRSMSACAYPRVLQRTVSCLYSAVSARPSVPCALGQSVLYLSGRRRHRMK